VVIEHAWPNGWPTQALFWLARESCIALYALRHIPSLLTVPNDCSSRFRVHPETKSSNAYIVGLNGEQLDETDENGYELHSNTFANGRVLFTYDENTSEWGVALSDWLGTKRVQVDPAIVGNLTSFQSLPFGDGLVFAGYGEDSTEHHFTGKEHDFESGNDYFGARYYSSTYGRFLSPDWSAAPAAVPYADLTNPQSLNLYGYVYNNPLTNLDFNGHSCLDSVGTLISDTSASDDEQIDETMEVGGHCDPGDLDPSLISTQQQIQPTQPQKSSFTPAPSNVNCNTVLPNGQTVGNYVQQYRAQLQSTANASGVDDQQVGSTTGAFLSIAGSNGPIDFKNTFRGQANAAMLGQAGNFAYYAIGSGILPNFELDAGAGAYAFYSAVRGRKPFSSLTGPMFSDASAASVRNQGLAANGCKTQ
jgi:RHS repeat-associated protein